jgi:hypothetical protein
MTFMSKQCAQYQFLNNTNELTSMSIPYKLMKNKFCMIIIAKPWPMKFHTNIKTYAHFCNLIGDKLYVKFSSLNSRHFMQ